MEIEEELIQAQVTSSDQRPATDLNQAQALGSGDKAVQDPETRPNQTIETVTQKKFQVVNEVYIQQANQIASGKLGIKLQQVSIAQTGGKLAD